VVYPLLFIWAANALMGPHTRRLAAPVLILLFGCQVVSAAAIMPDYLSYFPSYVGGPAQGYRYLVDSSLDWGQDLPALRTTLEQRHYTKVLFAYFGTASPAAYGLRAAPWRTATDAEVAACDWVAISATELQGVYGSRAQFSPFRSLAPTARAGYTIFLYDLSDPAVRSALREARAIKSKSR